MISTEQTAFFMTQEHLLEGMLAHCSYGVGEFTEEMTRRHTDAVELAIGNVLAGMGIWDGDDDTKESAALSAADRVEVSTYAGGNGDAPRGFVWFTGVIVDGVRVRSVRTKLVDRTFDTVVLIPGKMP